MAMYAPKNPGYLIYSFLLHTSILLVFLLSFHFTSTTPVVENSPQTNVVQAMVLNTPPPTQAIQPVKEIKPTPPVTPQPIKPAPAPKPMPEQPKTVKPEPLNTVKEAIVIPTKKPKIFEHNDIEKQLLAEVTKQTERKKKQKQKAVTAAFEKQIKELAAKSLQQQMLTETKRLDGARKQQAQGEVNKYKALVLQAISQKWIIPSAVNKKLSAELMIRVAPGGVVLEVQVIKKSGDDALDRSAQAAVYKASPLPVPTDADAFDTFRQFVLKVKPENVLSSDSWLS